MFELLGIMTDVIVPIFLVVVASFYLGKRFDPDPRVLSIFAVYLFVPALAFQGVATSDLSGQEVYGVAGVALGVAGAMVVIALGVSRLFKLDPPAEGAFVLSVMLVNAGNYGIPLVKFAFGTEGLQSAVVYYVTSVMIGNVLGVYFASRGKASMRQALVNVLKVPITYAALVGLLVRLANVSPPLAVDRAVSVAAEASVSVMLAMLGLQLAQTSLRGEWRQVMSAAGIRLLVSPLIAVPIALLLGLTGAAFNVAVIEASMPTAVFAGVLAFEFGSDANFTSAVTLVSTVASIVTLTALLALLN